MALAAASVFEVRTAGAEDNGAGFVTGAAGTDYSQQDAKRTATGTDDSTTDGVANGTTTFTSATANFGTTIVGNIICLSGGTGTLTKGWYQVTARASATDITLDRTVATGTGITMNIGGALASLGMSGGVGLVATNKIWVKSGTYAISSVSTNVTNGCFAPAVRVFVEGYGATRGDLGTKPLLQRSGGITNFTIVSQDASGIQSFRNFRLEGGSAVGSRGVNARGTIHRVDCVGFTNRAFSGTVATSLCIECYATGCDTVSPFVAINCIRCVSADNTGVPGFTATTSGISLFLQCIADSNSGATSDGFVLAGANQHTVLNCVSYNNGRDGFRVTSTAGLVTLDNCIAEGNVVGFNVVNVADVQLNHCAGFNTTDVTLGTGPEVYNVGFVTGSGSFFTNAAAQDFTLNNTAGAGADARSAGTPGTLPSLTTPVGYLDIGAFQHQDAGGGGGSESSHVFVG